jgi:hypothetical protein
MPDRLNETEHPLLYEVNTRVLLNELSLRYGKEITLGTIPEEIIEKWSSLGFDAIWLMGVWTTGTVGARIAREFEGLQDEYRRVLPDLATRDVVGSPYAVKAYAVSPQLGGNDGMEKLRKRLDKRGLGLILDFVCNHTARDHRWISTNPEFYVNGDPGEETEKPGWYFRAGSTKGDRVIAFGRDPTFPGWTDTAQLNHLHRGLREKLAGTLRKIGALCDGVRCDMAMLSLREVFERTWGEKAIPRDSPPAEGEFWEEVIASTKDEYPGFIFIAESYWDLEWNLQQLGFDYTYDKKFYDRLLREGASAVYDHLRAGEDYQRKSVRFIENHDEPRAASALSTPPWHWAAAAIMSTVPGMALFHDGQLEGRMVRVPVQLGRRPPENPSPVVECFYQKLLECLRSPVFRKGKWTLLNCRPAWHENQTWRNYLAFWWEGSHGCRLVVVNYAPHNGQCYVTIPAERLKDATIELRDLLGPAVYYREKSALTSKGMFFDLAPYGLHLFEAG